jgi:hypothetical protein
MFAYLVRDSPGKILSFHMPGVARPRLLKTFGPPLDRFMSNEHQISSAR